jgi:hypothetical protein
MHVVNMGLVFVSIRCTEDIICGNNDRFWKKLHWFKFQVTNNILVSWALYRQQWRWDKNIPTCWESLHFISLTSVPSSIRRLAKPHITWLGARLSSSEQNIRTGPNPCIDSKQEYHMDAENGICQISQIKPNLLLMSIVCASTLHAEPQFCLGREYPCQMPEPLPSRNVI